jgi:hypothetical protein
MGFNLGKILKTYLVTLLISEQVLISPLIDFFILHHKKVVHHSFSAIIHHFRLLWSLYCLLHNSTTRFRSWQAAARFVRTLFVLTPFYVKIFRYNKFFCCRVFSWH